MARSYLRLNDGEFWSMEPRTLFAMISEWQKIETGHARIQAYLNMGGQINDEGDETEYVDVHPDAF